MREWSGNWILFVCFSLLCGKVKELVKFKFLVLLETQHWKMCGKGINLMLHLCRKRKLMWKILSPLLFDTPESMDFYWTGSYIYFFWLFEFFFSPIAIFRWHCQCNVKILRLSSASAWVHQDCSWATSCQKY